MSDEKGMEEEEGKGNAALAAACLVDGLISTTDDDTRTEAS